MLIQDGVHIGARHPVRRHRGAPRVVAVGRPGRVGLGYEEGGGTSASCSGSRLKCRFCGTTPCSSARIAFIIPSAPDVDCMWPKFVLIDASAQAPSVPYTAARLAYSTGSPMGVPVPCASTNNCRPWRGRPHPRRAPCGTRRLAPLPTEPRVGGAAIPIGRGTPDDRQDAIAVALRVVQPLEQQHHAALAGSESVGRRVEGMAATGGRQHALQRSRNGLPRLEYHDHAPGQGELALAGVQAARRLGAPPSTRTSTRCPPWMRGQSALSV